MRSTRDIWLNEDLTASREELHYHARKLRREGHLSHTWSFLGEIYVKKIGEERPIRVGTRDELFTVAGVPDDRTFT